MGGCKGEVPASGRPDRRRATYEEGHVGTVLVGSPAILQVPVYIGEGGVLCATGTRVCEEWQGMVHTESCRVWYWLTLIRSHTVRAGTHGEFSQTVMKLI